MGARLYISLGLLSSSIIAFQLAMMQILSITQWYHFAYMIISIALLGFGSAGSLLALFRDRLMGYYPALLPLCMLCCSIAFVLVVPLTQTEFLRFDSYLLFAEWDQVGKLILNYLLFVLPFFFGALAIGMIFVREVGRIGSIYFANLVGSGIGGFAMLWVFSQFDPGQLPALVAFPVTLAAILVTPNKRVPLFGLSIFSLALCVYFIHHPPELHLSQYKDLSKTLLLPESKIVQEENSPHGLFQVVSSSTLRYGPGLSLTGTEAPVVNGALFVNGDWLGPWVDFDDREVAKALDHTTMALPYIAGQRKQILLLHAGSAAMYPQFAFGERATASLVESNGEVVDFLRTQLSQTGQRNGLDWEVYSGDSRHFIERDTGQYDLIMVPMIGAFGGSSGMYATLEQFLLTVEGFDQMLNRLTDSGVLVFSCWLDYPPRNPLKILTTIKMALEKMGKGVEQHTAAIRSWGTITFMVKNQPLTNQEVEAIRAFCDTMQFDPLLLSGIQPGERARYNELQDSTIFDLTDAIVEGEPDPIVENYAFKIQPATDNKPYFSQFLRLKSIYRLSQVFGSQMPFFEIGYLLVLVTLIQITVLAVLLILLPLFRLGWKGGNKMNVLLFFGGIGLGFMFLEIMLIQRLTFYFGSPVYAASAAISSLLIFSGIGSYLSGRFKQKKKWLGRILIFIVFYLIILSLSFTWMMQATIAYPLAIKMLLMTALIGPLALAMGVPFPTGLSFLSVKDADQIPWAWGINSCLSVVGAALAIVLAVEVGFVGVMVIAASAYVFSLLASTSLCRNKL